MTMQLDQISLMNLFTLGAHRGNKKSALNPRLKKRVYGINNGLSVIDLGETKKSLETAAGLLSYLGQKKNQLLLVGTAVHLRELTLEMVQLLPEGQAAYVDHRWLGGTLTNWSTLRKTLRALEKTQNMVQDSAFFGSLSRNEQLSLTRKLEKLQRFFGGLTNLKNNRPGAVIVLDARDNAVAIREAEAMKIPVVVLTNTGVQVLPRDLRYTIVCNTASVNAMKLIARTLVEAYNQGLSKAVAPSVITVKDAQAAPVAATEIGKEVVVVE